MYKSNSQEFFYNNNIGYNNNNVIMTISQYT